MKGNLFKDTRKQSFGYEPKEYSRYKRQLENKLSIKDKIFEIIKNDDCKNLLKYKNTIEKVLVYYNYNYKYKRNTIYDHFTRDWLYDTIIKNNAYDCFYYVFNKSTNLNVTWNIPDKFKEYFFERLKIEQRREKINKLKEKINQEN